MQGPDGIRSGRSPGPGSTLPAELPTMARKSIPSGRLTALWALVLLASANVPAVQAASVKAYEQDTVIPTYLAGAPEKSPMFFFGRQSQGAEGRIYPYPLYDTLTGKKVDKSYKLVYLENEYVKIGILPEIGGRLFEADRQDQRVPLLLPPARHQARLDRADRGLDFRRDRMEHSAPPPCVDIPAGSVPDRRERRWQQDCLGGRTGTAAPDALGSRLYVAAG